MCLNAFLVNYQFFFFFFLHGIFTICQQFHNLKIGQVKNHSRQKINRLRNYEINHFFAIRIRQKRISKRYIKCMRKKQICSKSNQNAVNPMDVNHLIFKIYLPLLCKFEFIRLFSLFFFCFHWTWKICHCQWIYWLKRKKHASSAVGAHFFSCCFAWFYSTKKKKKKEKKDSNKCCRHIRIT